MGVQGRVLTYRMAFMLTVDKKYCNVEVAEVQRAITDWCIGVDTAHPLPYSGSVEQASGAVQFYAHTGERGMEEGREIVATQPAEVTVITPEWVKDAVFYQIFPDRFAQSTRVEKPHKLEPWEAPPTAHGFKGGDLLGVVEHLDYLTDLGVDALYFCPIFQSTANHRYHTHDYYQVDPILGGNAAFKLLLEEAHKRNIRIVLDGVFNHASRGFYQFNHTLENGAASPYLDWFTFHTFPVHAYDNSGPTGYQAWWNIKALPKFNHANPQVREFLFRIAEYWIEQGIDGWRLDVPEEIDDEDFWCEFRCRVKAKNPDAYIVGEIWHRANRWLVGDQFDAVMNYQFTRACLGFFVEMDEDTRALTRGHGYGEIEPYDAPQFAQRLENVLTWYPSEIAYAQMNLLDSHDTARFLTLAKGDISAVKLAYLTMMTYPGAPMIYYGDEVGMIGGHDPDCRRAMNWDPSTWNHELLAAVKKYIALRKKYVALWRRGTYTHLYAQGKVYVFARQHNQQTVIVGVNAGISGVRLDLDVHLLLPTGAVVRNVWSEMQSTVTEGYLRGLTIPAREGCVWVREPAGILWR
jgi:neopullulanase